MKSCLFAKVILNPHLFGSKKHQMTSANPIAYSPKPFSCKSWLKISAFRLILFCLFRCNSALLLCVSECAISVVFLPFQMQILVFLNTSQQNICVGISLVSGTDKILWFC